MDTTRWESQRVALIVMNFVVKVEEGVGLKDYLHGPGCRELKVKLGTGDIGLQERGEYLGR